MSVSTHAASDPLLADPDLTHASAIAVLPPLKAEQRASIRAIASAADHFADKLRATIRGTR